MRTIVAHSADPDTRVALAALLERCDAELGGEVPVAGVLFSGIDADHASVVRALRERFPSMALAGCTTDGELSSSLAFQEDSLALMLVCGAGVWARAVLVRDVTDLDAVRSAVASASTDAKLCFAFPESLDVDSVPVVRAIAGGLPAETLLVGGTSGDQWRFARTHQFCDGEVVSNGLALLLLGGGFQASVGVSSGWSPLGAGGVVTRAEGAVIQEIDGQPAVDFYRRYFGDHIDPNPEFPTLVRDPGAITPYLRAPLRYDATTGAIVYAAGIPVGAQVQVASGPTADILEACRRSVEAASGAGKPVGAIAISCAARKQLLGTRTAREVDILRSAIGAEVPVIGFYSYGEIAPLAGTPCSQFHNETFVTVVLRDA